MTEAEIYSGKVKKEAEKLLETTNLLDVLSKYGQVIVNGSFKYDLMWGPDIDVIVICKDTRKTSLDALKKVIDLRLFQKYEYGDFEKFKRKNRPESYIINMVLPFEGQKWEIETWFFEEKPKSQEETDELIKNKLNKENKKIILEIKKKREEENVTKHKISSIDIYKAVLINDVKNYDELKITDNEQ